MKALFGTALRQTIGVVESMLRLVGVEGTVFNFNTLPRHQREMGPWPR